MTTYEKIEKLCNEKGIFISNLGQAMGTELSKSTISNWKKGITPRVNTLKKIADFFGVTVSYLSEDSANFTTIHDNHGFIGEANAPVTFAADEKLTEQEKALIETFRRLDVIKKAQVIAYAVEIQGK